MEIVLFDLAQKLKEKGFTTENTNWYYLNGELVKAKKYVNISPYEYAPTISQVLKWLREEKGWVVIVKLYETDGWYYFFQDMKGECYITGTDYHFDSYEQAAIAGIEYVLDNLI